MSRSSLRIEPLSVRISMLVFLGSEPRGSHHHNITFPYQLLTCCSLLNFLPVAYCVHSFNWPSVSAPSNPTSPGSQQSPTALHGSVGSPPGAVGSRPHSRAQSQSWSTFSHILPPQLDLANAMYEVFDDTVTKLPMQCMSADSDSDDSEDDSALGLVFDRSTASSTASMEPLERLDALQRTNADLAKKLVDAEGTLHRKLPDHEIELEEMDARLEAAKSELSAASGEEKELRSNER